MHHKLNRYVMKYHYCGRTAAASLLWSYYGHNLPIFSFAIWTNGVTRIV